MGLNRQQLSDESQCSQALRFEVREQLCPPEVVSEVVTRDHAWGKRERGLNQLVLVSSMIALSLCRRLTLAEATRHLACGLRWLWFHPYLRLPTAAAVVSRRRQLGTPVMRHLFQRVCHPMATEQTTGAFRFGLRLMAIDGTLDEVAETPATALSFGRMRSGTHQSPCPQVRCVSLAEVYPCHRRCGVRSLSGGRAPPRSPGALPCGAAGHARRDGSWHGLSRRAQCAGPSAASPGPGAPEGQPIDPC